MSGLCTDTQKENFESEPKSIVLKTILHQCIHVKCVMQTSNTLFLSSHRLHSDFLFFNFFRAESGSLQEPCGCAMSACAAPLHPPPAPPGALALVRGEANLVFGKFSSPEDLSGQSRSVGSE